jgi:phage I-like protein
MPHRNATTTSIFPPLRQTALQAMVLPAGEVPEWVHLLPAGKVETRDGRGPYELPDAAAVLAESLGEAGGRLPVDENHATDLAGPQGLPAPAMGWIVEMEARADGVWGRVEWTAAGRRLVEERSYRGISPVILHDKSGRIARILRASLTNTPNLRGLTTLHSERTETEAMDDFLKALRDALGLDDAAGQDAILAKAAQAAGADPDKALQSALAPIAQAIGIEGAADQVAVLSAVKALVAGRDGELVALQSEVASLASELKTMRDGVARERATAVVDAAIAAGKPGVKPRRDAFIARHMADPAGVEADLAALPGLAGRAPQMAGNPASAPATPGELTPSQKAVCSQLGLDPAKYLETLAAEAALRQEAM